MRKASKLVMAVLIITTAATLTLCIELKNYVGPKDSQEALAADPSVSRLSPELREALSRADPDELVSVWMEFDPRGYQKETNSSNGQMLSQFKESGESGFEKIKRKAFNELLPAEIVAIIFRNYKALEPPIEVHAHQFYLHWYPVEMTPSQIQAIAGFPGVQKITLPKPSEEISNKANPILVPYMAKAAQEYPSYKIQIIVDIRKELTVDPNTGQWSEIIDYNGTRDLVQKFGGEIATYWSDGVLANVPPDPQILIPISELENVQRIEANWYCHVID